MTIEEIFEKLANHMVEGISYHEEMAKAYDFLALWGFAKCQVYHCFEEKQGYHQLIHYYATHYFKLIHLENVPAPKLIPETWYKYTTQAVDTGTKKSSLRDLMNKWVTWERDTKKFYQEMRLELEALQEYATASKLDTYIKDVSKELHDVEKMILKLETINYDLITIEEWSDNLYKKYKKKLGW